MGFGRGCLPSPLLRLPSPFLKAEAPCHVPVGEPQPPTCHPRSSAAVSLGCLKSSNLLGWRGVGSVPRGDAAGSGTAVGVTCSTLGISSASPANPVPGCGMCLSGPVTGSHAGFLNLRCGVPAGPVPAVGGAQHPGPPGRAVHQRGGHALQLRHRARRRRVPLLPHQEEVCGRWVPRRWRLLGWQCPQRSPPAVRHTWTAPAVYLLTVQAQRSHRSMV